ncbi:MAG TPA: hypothetical protein VH394_14980 [Thermoanaerobaculia bacterium]|nr:hypothetical protein [Thermoanaerobaculia bacterium]
MSCPDWNALTAHRDERDGSEPAGWGEALTHLDGGCKLCRRQALAADPTLVFRRLAAVPAVSMTPAQERAEADAVRAAVAAMRAASRLDSLEARPRTSSVWKGWSTAALAACLALAAVVVPSKPAKVAPGAGTAAIFREGRLEVVEPLDEPVAAMQQVDLEEPVVEGVNLPDARVYHMSGEGLSVVMVVDESLDI